MKKLIKTLKKIRRAIYYEIRSFIRFRKRTYLPKGMTAKSYNIKQRVKALKTWGYTGSLFIRFYTAQTGQYSINYMPDNFYEWKITPKLNPRTERKIISDKTLLDVHFPDTTPVIAAKVDNSWYKQGSLISEADVHNSIINCSELGVVVKAAYGSQGSGVKFFSGDELEAAISYINQADNICVQKYIKQIEELSVYHPSSINTLRPITLFYKGKVHLLSALVRFGRNGSKLDNIQAGGFALVLKEDGSPYDTAVDKYYNKYNFHPDTKISFKSFRYPDWEKVIQFVVDLHYSIPAVGIVGWDVAVSSDRFWLLECNVNSPAIMFRQMYDGPLLKTHLPGIYKDITGKDIY